MASFLPLVLTVSLLVGCALSAETFWGRCPSVGALKEFNMTKFEGLWYVMESFDPRERCKTWTIKKNWETGNWDILEEQDSGPLSATGLDHKKYMSGTLSQPDKENNPAMLRSYYAVSGIAGDAAFTINNTDYENYAGLFECQNVGFFSRWSGFVLSREPVIKIYHRQNARIATDDIMVEYYQRVYHGASCSYQKRLEEERKREEERANREEERGDEYDFVPFGYGDGYGLDKRNRSHTRPGYPDRGDEGTYKTDEDSTDATFEELFDEQK